MQYNEVEIIAAAPGTIIGKGNGLFDQNCAMCTSSCDWNAVYVRHSDGSVAWYGHMKSGSLTSEAVGATVSVGEYLGVVGSSGSSTGPHLHFEVYENDSYTKLIDPWAGTCNAHNGNTSWWASQQPYRVSTIDALMIHSAAPVLSQCPGGEAANEKRSFTNGQVVYLGTYYRDQLNLQTVTHTVRRPDNSVYLTWNQNFTSDYNASYWYYYFTLLNPATTGVWKYEVTYNSQTFNTNFAVNSMLQYTFNGNGNFTDAANWQAGNMPFTPIPSGAEVIVNTTGANECIINQQVVFLPGSKLTIAAGSKLKMSQNLQMQ